jgi:hypothetical protein
VEETENTRELVLGDLYAKAEVLWVPDIGRFWQNLENLATGGAPRFTTPRSAPPRQDPRCIIAVIIRSTCLTLRIRSRSRTLKFFAGAARTVRTILSFATISPTLCSGLT